MLINKKQPCISQCLKFLHIFFVTVINCGFAQPSEPLQEAWRQQIHNASRKYFPEPNNTKDSVSKSLNELVANMYELVANACVHILQCCIYGTAIPIIIEGHETAFNCF